jgi:TolB-like protein
MVVLDACASRTVSPPGREHADSAAVAQFERERAATDTVGARPTLAVTPFRAGSRDANLDALGFAIADLLTTDLSRSSRVQLVERARIADLIREQDLARTGRVDSATAPRVGKLLRAQRLVLGSIDTLPGGDIRLGVRVAEVESGVLNQAVDARSAIAEILDAERELALRLFASLGITLTPAERAQIDVRRTSNINALAAYGRGVQAELAGDRRRANDEYERALRIDPAFRQPAERISAIKADAQGEQGTTALVPSARSIGAPVSSAVDRLNRPLDLITSVARPSGGPGDPAFPSTMVTVLLRIRRP